MTGTRRQPWEQQDGESAKAFQAFVTYRDMGAVRSYTKVAQQLHKSRTLIGRWARRWNWQNRVKAWDDHCDEIRRGVELQETIKEMTRRHIEAGRQLEQKGLQLLSTVRRATAQGAARLVTAGVDIQRLARGAPTESVELRGRLLDEAIERELAKLAAAAEERVSDATGQGSQGD